MYENSDITTHSGEQVPTREEETCAWVGRVGVRVREFEPLASPRPNSPDNDLLLMDLVSARARSSGNAAIWASMAMEMTARRFHAAFVDVCMQAVVARWRRSSSTPQS